MVETLKECKERTAEAWQKKSYYERQLRDIYRYIMPFRDPVGLESLTGQSEGQNRTDDIFDGTAPRAALNFPGMIQSDLMPIFQQFFSIEAGPLIPEGDAKKQLTQEFQRIGKIVNGMLTSGAFHMKSFEMFLDLFAGTGALNIGAGDNFQPVRFQSAPIAEIALEKGPYGDIWGVDWKKEYKARHLKTLWPRGEFGSALKTVIENSGATPICIHQNTYYDAHERRWYLKVWRKGADDSELIWEEPFRTNRWITPRFFVVPGEVYGRGLAHLGLPSAKTTNKARELALLAAAFAVLGLWTRRNDGVFNPDTARFEPLAMWQVASTGGPLGPTLQRLDVPHNFDISSFVIEDERQQMRTAMMDDALPPIPGAVRSPTEIVERLQIRNQHKGGILGRMTLEVVAPTVQAVIDVLETQHLLNTNLTIDQLITQVRVIAPIAAAQQAEKVSSVTQWLQLLVMLFGPQAALVFARAETLAPQLGRWLGVDEEWIRSNTEISDWQKLIAGMMAAGQQQDGGQQQEQPPAGQFVNGGAL